MATPFSSPFGAQNTTCASSQTNVFGSTMFGQQTQKPTQVYTSSSGNQAGAASSLFGGQTSTTSGSVFGQQSSFGQSGRSAFGQQANFGQSSGSSFGQQGSFGQFVSSGFGQQASFGQSGSSTFGHQGSFGQTGSGLKQAVGDDKKQSGNELSMSGGVSSAASTTSAGLFGTTGNTSAFRSSGNFSSVFGQRTSVSGGLKSGVLPEFGAVGNQSSVAAGLFGKPQPAADTSVSGASQFGQRSDVSASRSSDSVVKSENPPQYLFGKLVKKENVSKNIKEENTFAESEFKKDVESGSKQASMGQTSTGVKTESQFGIGPPKQPGDINQEDKKEFVRQRLGMFGKTGTGIEDQGVARFRDIEKERTHDDDPRMFGKHVAESRVSRKGLFGKPVRSRLASSANLSRDEERERASEYEKERTHEGERDPDLFGKETSSTSRLFRKHVAERASPVDVQEEEESPGGWKSSGKSSARKLFGKPEDDESHGARKGLFGKPAVSRLPSSEDKDSRPSVRRQISDDLSNKVAIVCRNIPSKFNTTFVLRDHFKKFGEVTKVFPNKPKMQAIVHFRTHEAAAEAKRRGRLLQRGLAPMTIFWSNYTPSPAPGTSRSSVDEKTTKSVKRGSDAEGMPSSKRTSWKAADDINEELESMSGTQDLKGQKPEVRRSPEKRSRAPSPAQSTSSSTLDSKHDKIQISMFEGQIAKTTTDRVNLLNLRDKYMRQNKEKGKSDMVKAFVGTCPDMCPEKERYDREDKRQLSVFEIIPGTENIPGRNPQVDHSRAVKEYLRSSPDQDEPLPHELRPLPVLQATMQYLLLEIADRGEDGMWGDWFDFLWNRTRGIRKDIIQQQLSDRGAVDLIEKCARFHIYSSERLCEEDMHAFDSKINNENLTKCLQTLKEFYTDLETKQKCFCPNEAEFRAYRVLMNLNEGDILREVQQFRPEIRTSALVKFALSAYFALNSNNYIKFFRLVKQATFLNACILHRYFQQVRNRGITLMMRGYRLGNRPAQIPLMDLVRLLAFESEEEAGKFCQHYGLRVSNGEVSMDRTDYIEPETALAPRRSVKLIESKLLVSVGELINGEAFRPTAPITPVSSFDASGRFQSAVALPKLQSDSRPQALASDQEESEQQPESQPSEVKAKPPPVEEKPLLKKVPVELIKDSAKVLFWEVIDELGRVISEEVMVEVKDKLILSEEVLCSIVDEGLREECRKISSDVCREAEIERDRALKLELEQRRDRVAEVLTDVILGELIIQESRNLATIEVREVKAQLKRECIERVTVDISAELVEDVMKEMVVEVSEDVYEVDVRQRLKQLDDFENIVKLSRTMRFWNYWKAEYTAVKKLKRAMEEFPCAPNMQSMKDQLKSLIITDDEKIVDKKFYINKRAKLTVESPLAIEKLRKETDTRVMVHRLYRKLLHETAWAPLDVGKLVGRHLARQTVNRLEGRKHRTLFWKLLLCLPDTSDSTTAQLCDWLKTKFSKGSTPATQDSACIKSQVLSLYRCPLLEATRTEANRPNTVGVCVRTVEGLLDQEDILAAEEEALFLGTRAVMFVLPAGAPLSPTAATYKQYWLAQHTRLEAVLKVKPDQQQFPLVVVFPVTANQRVSCDQIVQHMSLADLQYEELISEVELVTYTVESDRPDGIDYLNPRVSEQLCESIQWLSERTQPVPELCVQHFKDIIDVMLQKHYFSRVQENQKKRKELNRLDKDPNSLLLLFNRVIYHVSEVLNSDILYTVSWPVSEFTNKHSSDLPPRHWNKRGHLEYVYYLVHDLDLPEFLPRDLNAEDWSDIKKDLWKYVTSLADIDYSGARVKLFSRLKKMIHCVEEDFAEACYFQYGEPDCKPTNVNVPWTTFISMCIDYQLDMLDLVDPDSTDTQAGKEELRVAYIPSEMGMCEPPHSWRYPESEKDILDTPSVEDSILTAVSKARELRERNKARIDISIVEDPDKLSIVTVETRKTSGNLISSLKSERRESDHFQNFLEKALRDGPDSTDLTATDLSYTALGSGNQSFGTCDVSAFPGSRRFSLELFTADRQSSFDATAYFNQTQNISALFDPVVDESQNRRKSDVGLADLSFLPSKKRRQRLSEAYNNDRVMMYLREPTMEEDVNNLRENLKSSRRDSDMFEKKLMSLLQDKPKLF